jgi:hypothetical protein
MAVKPNAHVQAELDRLRDEWDRGAVDGYEADPNRTPAWFTLGYHLLYAYQRGYLWGRELRIRESQDNA